MRQIQRVKNRRYDAMRGVRDGHYQDYLFYFHSAFGSLFPGRDRQTFLDQYNSDPPWLYSRAGACNLDYRP
jgi:hypothetical protein